MYNRFHLRICCLGTRTLHIEHCHLYLFEWTEWKLTVPVNVLTTRVDLQFTEVCCIVNRKLHNEVSVRRQTAGTLQGDCSPGSNSSRVLTTDRVVPVSTLPNWRLPCCRYWTICRRSSSIVCCCSWWTFWTLGLNTEKAADVYHRKIWTDDEKLCKLWFVITEYSGRDCCSLVKVNFKV